MCMHLISLKAQLLQTRPRFIQQSTTDSVQIILNPALGNQALASYTGSVYVHIGVITTKSTGSTDWKYVHSVWGTADNNYECRLLENGNWSFTIQGGLRSFFGIQDTSEHILKICVLFRNTDGTLKAANADGTDMYLPVYDSNLHVRIDQPAWAPTYTPSYPVGNLHVGDIIEITGYANRNASLTLSLNAKETAAVTDTMIHQRILISTVGSQSLVLKGIHNQDTSSQILPLSSSGYTDTLSLPTGLKEGVNYDETDPTKATLVLFAPGKNNIYAIGDFNNWQKGLEGYQMHITPDGQLFWLTLENLQEGKPYAYQLIINDSLTVADYNAHLILDKANDPSISAQTYPNLPQFPSKATGQLVGVLETGQTAYQWHHTNFKRPDKHDLRIYELLVRDFTKNHNWNSLTDSLDYLAGMGINAIELMPFNEFEGNSSWGYNPDFYFAPDKYYGTAGDLKAFIDSCHGKGIAVIMDMVLNHSFGQSPMVQMYFDSKTGRPSSDNPWFNPVAKHAYNVGYDFNHESEATKAFTKRVMAYWLTEYRIDGYRFDLAKGFTQKQTCDSNGAGCNVDAWSAYDSSRVAIWDEYYKAQQQVDPGSYAILELLGNNQEEQHYSEEGMLLWENGNGSFNQLTMGYADGSDISSFIYTNRGWSQNNMIVYMESHDEERLMYKNLQYGNTLGSYDIKDSSTALNRNAMAAVLWGSIPGPKMLWEFGELGYDYSINYCMDGSGKNDCRTGPKPSGWPYLMSAGRLNLKRVYQQMFYLRSLYSASFSNGKVLNTSVLSKTDNNLKTLMLTSDSLDLAVIANFGVAAIQATLKLPDTGFWQPYITGTGNTLSFITQGKAFVLQNTDTSLSLPAGAFQLWVRSKRRINVNNWISDLNLVTENGYPQLSWESPLTDDSTTFIIEKAPINGKFQPIATIPAKTGNKKYQFNDFSSNLPCQYRIAVINLHGSGNSNTLIYQPEENLTENRVLAFPNPSSRYFHIKITAQTVNAPYTISNQMGRIVAKGSLSAAGGDIDLGNLAAGVYFMRVEVNNKIYKTVLLKK